MALSKDNSIIDVLKCISPGTPIREGLDNILKAKTGGLIVIGDSKEVLDIVDGAFSLSSDLKKILYANAQLIPSSEVQTSETGTRHRTAERTAKQTGELVISISQRRNIITIFKGYARYVLQDTSKVLTEANQALQTVEKYKKVFDNKLSLLNEYEFNDIVTLQNVVNAIERAELVMKIVEEIQKEIYELGIEGRLIEMQLDELVGGLEKEELLIIKDYIAPGKKRTSDKVLEQIRNLPREDLMKEQNIANLLGYEAFDNYDEVAVFTRGYRVLSKIPRMPSNIVDNLVKSFKSFQHILAADIPALDDVEGIGEIRAKTIKQSLKRMQEQFIFDNLFDNKLSLLNEYEFNDIVTLQNVVNAIERAELVMKIVEEIQKEIYELGIEGRLIEMQLDELVGGLEKEELLIIKDYIAPGKKRTSDKVLEQIRNLPREDLMKEQNIANLLGYEAFDNYDEVAVFTRGYRVLSKIPRMPSNIVDNLVKSFKSFQHILAADIPALDDVEGIGEIRAKTIKQSLKRMQEQFIFDNLYL